MSLLKSIFFSINTFMFFLILIIVSLIIIQYSYFQIMLEKDNLKSLKDIVYYLFYSTLFFIIFYWALFYLKIKEYIKRVKSYTKPFEFISLIASLMFTLGTILWNYKFIKYDEKFELTVFSGNSIIIDRIIANGLNIYFNLFILLSAFLLLLIIFLLLLNFNIEDYKNKNRLYKNYILTKNGWIEGSYKISYDSNEIKVIEPDDVLLVVRAFINFDKYKLYEERFFLNTNLPKSDYYIEEIELLKKHFCDEEISKYFDKYSNYSLEQYNIKNTEILEKFKNKK